MNDTRFLVRTVEMWYAGGKENLGTKMLNFILDIT
jgi:hypothetical protein